MNVFRRERVKYFRVYLLPARAFIAEFNTVEGVFASVPLACSIRGTHNDHHLTMHGTIPPRSGAQSSASEHAQRKNAILTEERFPGIVQRP